MSGGPWAQTINPIAIQKNVACDLDAFIELHGRRNNIDDLWLGVYGGPTLVATFPVDAAPGGQPTRADVAWFPVTQVFNVTDEGTVTIRIGAFSDDVDRRPGAAPARVFPGRRSPNRDDRRSDTT